MDNIQYGNASEGDFEKGTITFEMEGRFWIRSSRYAVVDIGDLSIIQLQQFEDFINKLKEK